MYNETQLQALKLFGDKTLSFGCLFYPNDDDFGELYRFINRGDWQRVRDGIMGFPGTDDGCTSPYAEILGHEPHLENLVKVSIEEGTHCTIMSNGVINFHREMSLSEDIPYDFSLSFLDQPSLSEIVNLLF